MDGPHSVKLQNTYRPGAKLFEHYTLQNKNPRTAPPSLILQSHRKTKQVVTRENSSMRQRKTPSHFHKQSMAISASSEKKNALLAANQVEYKQTLAPTQKKKKQIPAPTRTERFPRGRAAQLIPFRSPPSPAAHTRCLSMLWDAERHTMAFSYL